MRFRAPSAEHLFIPSELFTDRARFGGDGIVSIHNHHQWAD
jgi:hypothetical protein